MESTTDIEGKLDALARAAFELSAAALKCTCFFVSLLWLTWEGRAGSPKEEEQQTLDLSDVSEGDSAEGMKTPPLRAAQVLRQDYGPPGCS